MPGIDKTGGVMGLGARLIIRLQFGRGQAIRCDELLHMSRQLQGHRTYFLPGGAFRIGCIEKKKKTMRGMYTNYTNSQVTIL